MGRSVDGKSFLIGGLVVLVAVCAMAMTGVHLMDGQYNGRFAMVVYPAADGGSNVAVVSGAMMGDVEAISGGTIVYPLPSLYILDTATGQVWTPSYPDIETFYASKLEGHGVPEGPGEPNGL